MNPNFYVIESRPRHEPWAGWGGNVRFDNLAAARAYLDANKDNAAWELRIIQIHEGEGIGK